MTYRGLRRMLVAASVFAQASAVPAQDVHEASLKELSLRIEQTYDRSGMLLADSSLEKYLTGVLLKLFDDAEVVDRSRLRVRVLLSPSFNAYAAPHGTIFVCTGLLARMENEAELGALLGHELTHITRRHSVRNLAKVKKSSGAGARAQVGLEILLGGMSGMVNDVVVRSAVTGYSRDLEREADSVGLARMRHAGYAPAHFRNLFVKLKRYIEEEKVKEPFFFSTHPRIVERIESYGQLMGGDTAHGDLGKLGAADFLNATSVLINADARMNVAAGKFDIAEDELTKLLVADSCNVDALITLGTIARLRGFPQVSSSAGQWYRRAAACDTTGGESSRALGYYLFRANRDSAAVHLRAYLESNPAAPDRPLMEEYLRQCSGK